MGMSTGKSGSKGRRGRGRSKHAPMSEINVTPFVDVMLVLLIIFMVAAPLLTVGVPLDLPEDLRCAAQRRHAADHHFGRQGRQGLPAGNADRNGRDTGQAEGDRGQ